MKNWKLLGVLIVILSITTYSFWHKKVVADATKKRELDWEKLKQYQQQVNTQSEHSSQENRSDNQTVCSICGIRFSGRGYGVNNQMICYELESPYQSTLCGCQCVQKAHDNISDLVNDARKHNCPPGYQEEQCEKCFGGGEVVDDYYYSRTAEKRYIRCPTCGGKGRICHVADRY
jgi:hypothetical protein